MPSHPVLTHAWTTLQHRLRNGLSCASHFHQAHRLQHYFLVELPSEFHSEITIAAVEWKVERERERELERADTMTLYLKRFPCVPGSLLALTVWSCVSNPLREFVSLVSFVLLSVSQSKQTEWADASLVSLTCDCFPRLASRFAAPCSCTVNNWYWRKC